MSDINPAGAPIEELPSDVPVEAVPFLASNQDAVHKLETLRELKLIKDKHFTDKKDDAGVPVGTFERLKIDLGALISVARVKSIVFQDLRVLVTEASQAGAPGSGSVDGAILAGIIRKELGPDLTPDHPEYDFINLLINLIAISRGFDEELLSEVGLPPHVIGRSRGVGKGRKSSVRVEWVGSKGKGKMKAGATGTVQ